MTIGDEFEARRQASLASPRSHPDLLPHSVTRMASPNKWRGVHELLADYTQWMLEGGHLPGDTGLVQLYIDHKEQHQ